MIASSTIHPWKDVISGATMYLSGSQANTRYDCAHMASNFGTASNGVKQQNANAFMNLMGSYALEYVLNTTNSSSTTWRNKITCMMDLWPAMSNDQPVSDDYNLSVPFNGAFVNMVVAYDEIYNDLSAVQISSYNAMMDSWTAYNRSAIGPASSWEMSPHGAEAVWSVFRDTDAAQIALDTACYHVDLLGNEQIYPPAVCGNRQAYHSLSSEDSVAQLNRDGVSGSGSTYAWARIGGESREKLAKWITKDILTFTGKDATYAQTPSYSTRPLLSQFYDWLFTFTITPWGTKTVLGDTANNQSSGADNFQNLSTIYGKPVYLLSNAWLAAGKYSPYAQSIAASSALRISSGTIIYPGELVDYVSITSSVTATAIPTKSLAIRNGGAAFWDENTSSQTIMGVLENAHLTRGDHYHLYDFNGLFLSAYGVEMLSNPGNGASTQGGVGGLDRNQTQCQARYGNVLLMGNTNFANAPDGVNYGGASGQNCNSFWTWNPFITGTQNQQYVGNGATPLYGGDGILESLVSSKFDYAVGLTTGPYVYFDTTTGVTTQFLGQDQRNFLFVHSDTATSVNGYWVVDDEVMSASYTLVNQIWHPYGVNITTTSANKEYSWDIFLQLQASTQSLTVFLASPPQSVLFSTSAFAENGPGSVSSSNGNYVQANYLNGSYAVHASSAHILTVLYPSDQSGHNKSTFTRISDGEAEGASVLSGNTTDYFLASNGSNTVTMQGATFLGKLGFMRKNSGTKQFFVRQGTTFDDGASPRYGFDSSLPTSVHLRANAGAITSALTTNVTFYYPGISGVLVDGVAAAGTVGANKFSFSVAPGSHTLSLNNIIVSSKTGDWNDSNTWVGGFIPGNGDTVSIFHTVSVTDTETVGGSLATGNAINLNSTGTIHVTSTGHLIQRGYGTYTAGSGNLNDAVDADGCSAWEFDASQSTSPTTLHYGFYPSTTNGFRKFKISGSSSCYASVYNTVASTNALLGQNGQAAGGVYELLYASVTRINFEIAYNNGSSMPIKWDAQHSSFTHCGMIDAAVGGNMESSSTFKHEYNYHQDSVGATIFNLNFTSKKEALGTRSIKGNIFDIQMSPQLGLGDFTIRDNFMGAGYNSASASWTLFTNNFIRMTQANANMGMTGTMSDSYAWWDDDQQNAHVFTTDISSSMAMSGMIWGQSGRAKATGADDSGEFWLQSGPDNISTMSITNSIFLANGAGYASLQITSMLGTANPNTYLNNRLDVNHNTYFGGWDNSNSALPPFAAMDFSESSNMGPGTMDSFRSNLLWNPQLSATPGQFFKTLDVGNANTNQAVGFGTGPTQDVCAPSRCDYNAAYVALATATVANVATYTNQGNGYAGKYSSTPGVHDVNGQNPNFVDYKRYVEKFDSAYWRPYYGLAQPAAWLSGATYNQGDIVSHSSGTYYWGDSINYVYISSGFCTGSVNPEPGVIPVRSWNKCWKFQSIQDIKAAIISSTTFTDATIGAVNSNVNQTLLKWIRAGYSPLNPAYHLTAHDGGDIGAVAVGGTAGNPRVLPSTAVVTVGGTVQFVTTSAVTWSMTAGSVGSINSSGLYTAPTTYFTAKNISPAGCPLRPNDDIVNTRIDALPVDSSSTFRFAHAFTTNGGSSTIRFEPTMPTNIYNSGTPSQNMNFRSTSGDNGPFPLLSSATRMEENSSISNDPTNTFQDHHILGVDSSTCRSSEMYGYYPTGADAAAPASNSGAGFRYMANAYKLPDRTVAAGGTDAAGMAIQPLLLRYSELKSGKINHALRFTLNNANFYAPPAGETFIWPATEQAFHNSCAGGSINCFHYGARIRLKSTYNCSNFTSPGSQSVCTALQQYGGFLVDGGTTWGLTTNYDVTEDTTAFADIFTLLNSSISTSQLEQVDESSLMVSTFSGVVNPSNAYVTPSNFAQVVITSIADGSTTTVNVALQPVTVGWGNPAYQGLDSGINVMAGTPQFQIPYWVNGATDTAATCAMTPAVGSLTSDCKYTAPAAQYNSILITTVTITSHIDPNHASSSFFMTIFSTDAIRIRMGPATSGSNTIPPYFSNGNYQDAVTGGNFFEEPANNVPNWDRRDIQGNAGWPNQLYNNFSYGAGDKVFSAMVPPGIYSLQMNSGTGPCCGDVAASSNSIETQGLVFQSTTSLAPDAFVPKVISTNLTVGSNNAFYWAIRGNDSNSHNFLSYWSLVPTLIPRNTETLQGIIKIQGRVILQ